MKSILYKIIYSSTINYFLRPFAKFIYKLTGKKIITISGILPISIYGINFKLKTNQTCSVTQDLYYNKPENYEFTPLFSDLIKNCEIFFDIGANIGYFTILAGKINPNTKIFTFEPSHGPSHFVEENIKINNILNANLIKKAISNIDGKLLFHDVINSKYPWIKYNLNGSNSLQNNYGLYKSSSYNVEVTTIKTVINEYKLNQIDLIKLDTECTEHLILLSSIETIRQLNPIIICEVYDVIAKEVQTVLDNLLNYEIFQYRNHKIKRINSLLDVSNDEKYRNFIFCPKEKLDFIKKYITHE